MAETPVSASPPPPPPPPPASQPDTEPLQYWCYHCEKRVSVETVTDLSDIICFECKNGFVELISISSTEQQQQLRSSSTTTATGINTNRNNDFSNQFLQILRLIAEAARDEENPPPPPPPVSTDPHPESGDFLRIELNGWNNDEDDDDQDQDQDEDDGIQNDGIGVGVGVRAENEIANEEENDDEEEDEDEEDEEEIDPDEEPEPGEDDIRRRRRSLLRLRIRDFATRATIGRNRILDWSEILMGLEDNTMEFRVDMPEWDDAYVGNPEDYLDAAGYEALLQNLAESDGTRKGAPPASKSAVLALKTLEVAAEEEALVCSICKEAVQVGEKAKKMPCGHGYHGECIVTWLGSRNTCPICRFELPTEDPDYEEQRKKRSSAGSSAGGSSNSGSNSRIS